MLDVEFFLTTKHTEGTKGFGRFYMQRKQRGRVFFLLVLSAPLADKRLLHKGAQKKGVL
jgi:hypothetical protein